MNRTLPGLKHTARDLAEHHGHTLGEWENIGRTFARGKCQKCKMEVDVNTAPAPNQTDISGPAIAVQCGTEYKPAGVN